MTAVLATIVFLLVIVTSVSIHSALRAGRELDREIHRVTTEGRER